jgi:hypothetical protein
MHRRNPNLLNPRFYPGTIRINPRQLSFLSSRESFPLPESVLRSSDSGLSLSDGSRQSARCGLVFCRGSLDAGKRTIWVTGQSQNDGRPRFKLVR